MWGGGAEGGLLAWQTWFENRDLDRQMKNLGKAEVGRGSYPVDFSSPIFSLGNYGNWGGGSPGEEGRWEVCAGQPLREEMGHCCERHKALPALQ